MSKWPTHSHISGSKVTNCTIIKLEGELASELHCAHESLDVCRFQKITPANAIGFLCMSHPYAPAPTHSLGLLCMSHTCTPAPAHANATPPAPTASGFTCVTRKWLIPLDIRPSSVLPLCECATPKRTAFCSGI
ncbi:hypothetical protein O181_046972 [Austropuccinia psidii MF-1]|uniref:Uncharacterized protein n=1 Tax=Austropuccinia psidii MF-1 TaxID=1389203 RepID=A0A9Q3DWY5_9BASI|nr:hypothetical protein [Austropuccinia psidii MF-1]